MASAMNPGGAAASDDLDGLLHALDETDAALRALYRQLEMSAQASPRSTRARAVLRGGAGPGPADVRAPPGPLSPPLRRATRQATWPQ
jgi:hypothetical protein